MIKFDYNKKMLSVFGVKELKILTQTLTISYRQKYFLSKKRRKIELCLSCYEIEKDLSYEANEDFNKFLDDRYEKLIMLDNMRRF